MSDPRPVPPTRQAAHAAHKLLETQKHEDLHATVEHLRAQLHERDATIRKYQKSRGGLLEVAREIAAAVKALEPAKPVRYVPRDPSKSEVVAVANLSDLHFGELIRPAETGGFGAFNYAIGSRRMDAYRQNFLDWVTLNRRSYNVSDCHIFGIGDYVSGDIHQELLVTNEFPLPVQTARAGDQIARFVRDLAPHFRKLVFHGVGADNHGRLVRKPQAKQKAENNMSFLVHALVESSVRNVPNAQIINYEDFAPLIEVAAHNFLVTHGDTVKSWQGVPWYGLERYIAKEATRRMGGREFHYVNCGHYHTPVFLQRLIMNGSLSGTTEFDHTCGRFGPPTQVSYLVHPRWGVFNFTAWKFAVEREETDVRRTK